MSALLLQQLRDRAGVALGWTAGWLVLVGMYVGTWPTVRDNGDQYDQILRDLPAALRSVLGTDGSGAFSTPSGYFTAELLAVTGPALALTMGVLLGGALLARDEEEGTLEVLLAQPVSRTSLLLARVAEAALELLAVLTAAGTALFALGLLVDLDLSLGSCLRATSMLALLGLEGMSLALLLGCLTGRAGRSKALAGGVGLVAFLLNALGPSIDALTEAVPLSPFHTLIAADPFRQQPTASALLALALPSVILVGASALALRRRDLHFR